ncbi:MAG: HD domain-containing protein [Proteobacteria bacterium]|nr:HD domain-containing protein [Pseudomonadota bacterium]MBU1687915.1 HD domain-containing protein [Pseudomonadota bacterium]
MQCPGQDSRYWDGAAVFDTKCPECGGGVEFFKDDNTRKCGSCGYRLLNPRMDFGCASYCPYAEQCLGELPPELLSKKQDLLKDRSAIEMKKYFGTDFRRIGHATRVARYVEEIGGLVMVDAQTGSDFNPAVAGIAAYLHDIGIKEAERKHQSSSPQYQHQEGPVVARDILSSLQANEGLIDEVCDIIGHHHLPRATETMNFKVLYDADLITNLEEKQKDAPSPRIHLEKIVDRSFLTREGALVAARVLLDENK